MSFIRYQRLPRVLESLTNVAESVGQMAQGASISGELQGKSSERFQNILMRLRHSRRVSGGLEGTWKGILDRVSN